MRYYLETNALYSINKIADSYLKKSYTSLLALFELISGITKSKFEKRRNILNKVLESNIQIKWIMPENLIFQSFDVFNEYEFVEERLEPLKNLINRILASENFENFENSNEYKNQKYNFEYFKELDKSWCKEFVEATIKGNIELKEIIKKQNNQFVFNDISYKIDSRSELEKFFKNEDSLNRSITILALAIMLKKKGIDELTEEVIYNSYNGNVDIYVNSFFLFCSNKSINFDSPAKNDFADLAHLIYLKNIKDSYIVSQDKIFKKVIPEKTIDVERLTTANTL